MRSITSSVTRSITRTSALFAALLCAAPIWAQDMTAPVAEADTVLAKMVVAMGGAEAHAKVKTRIVKERIVMKMMGMELTSTTHQSGTNVNQNVVIPGIGTQLQGRTGDVVWATDPMQGPRLMAGAERDMFVRMTGLFPYMHVAKEYPTRTVVGREAIGERECYKVELKPESGAAEYWFLDTETHLMLRMSMTYDGPMGKMPMVIDLKEYRAVDGIQYPFKVTMNQAGNELAIETTSVEHNVEIAPAAFAMPADIQKLVDKKKAADAPKAPPVPGGVAPKAETPKDAPKPKPTSQPAGAKL